MATKKTTAKSNLPKGGQTYKPSEFFKFEEPGECIIGTVSGEGESQYGRYIVLAMDDGTKVKVAVKVAQLDSAYNDGFFSKGARVGIEFMGTVDSQVAGHQPYKTFNLVKYAPPLVGEPKGGDDIPY